MSRRTRLIHFVGIGGIGMSGIAEVLINLGYKVRGSDLRKSETTERLSKLGGDIRFGHSEQNIEDVDVVVVSTAVSSSNPEVSAARKRKIPVIRRAEMLAELMRLKFGIAIGGTHGKTTTTSIVASLLTASGMDPTVVVGGKLNKLGSNAKLGQGPYLVAEADESDGSFHHLNPTIVVVTNIDAEHLDFYTGGIDQIRETFTQFINRIPFYGLAILCSDHPGVQKVLPLVERRFVTYGLNPQAEIRAANLSYTGTTTSFDLIIRGANVGRCNLPMLGTHNVQNALAAFAIADELGIETDTAISGIESFDGVQRRFTLRGTVNNVSVIDDYGHHPEEIKVTLDGARKAFEGRRIVVGFQPHRFTRTRDFLEDFSTCFNEAELLVLSKIYAAGEQPIEGITSEHLATLISSKGHKSVTSVDTVSDVAQCLAEQVRPGDLVITFGAGDIWRAGEQLLSLLAEESENI
ncbi:MAG: UDP-N-acetylmuramate--L-alanine ligase [Myxococcota bacterium]|nr:UDP-N-acetylmuramate--L-alanine ligase [Myxococcota bacterium]